MYVNLDSIPAKKTLEAREAAARQSYKNQQVMKEAGLHPIPVFHQGENWLWLEKMLKDGETPGAGASAQSLSEYARLYQITPERIARAAPARSCCIPGP